MFRYAMDHGELEFKAGEVCGEDEDEEEIARTRSFARSGTPACVHQCVFFAQTFPFTRGSTKCVRVILNNERKHLSTHFTVESLPTVSALLWSRA